MSTPRRSSKRGPQPGDLNALKASLTEFYSKKENADKVLPILNRKGPVSGRLLEFFVVNFSKQNGVRFKHGDRVVDVHNSYDDQLKVYHKAFFDPFKRSETCVWTFAGEEKHEVTLGQLCFLKWVVVTGIIEYIEANLPRISQAMREHLTRPREPHDAKRGTGARSRNSRKRSPPQVTAVRGRALVGDCFVVHF